MFNTIIPSKNLILTAGQREYAELAEKRILEFEELLKDKPVQAYDFQLMGNKTVVCTGVWIEGFELSEYSCPVRMSDFNLELAKILAKEKVLNTLVNINKDMTAGGVVSVYEYVTGSKIENVEKVGETHE